MLDVFCHFIVFYCHVYVISLSFWFGKCNKNANKNYYHLGNTGKRQNMQTKITPNLGNAQTMQTKKQRKTNATKETMKTNTYK